MDHLLKKFEEIQIKSNQAALLKKEKQGEKTEHKLHKNWTSGVFWSDVVQIILSMYGGGQERSG